MTATTEKPAIAPPAKLPAQFGMGVLQTFERHAETPAAEEGKPQRRIYRIQISNDTPFERYGEIWILGHKPGEIDLTYAEGGLEFWLEHGGPNAPSAPDPRYHLGRVTNFSIENGALWGDAEFAEDAALDPIGLLVKRDWESENPTRRYISVGQRPMDYTLKVSDGQLSERRWTQWQAREVAVVGVPSIPNTGRHSASNEEFEVRNVTAPQPQHEPTQPEAKEEAPMTATTQTPTSPATPGVEVGADRLAARNAEVVEIQTMCEAYQLNPEIGRDMIKRGLSLKDAKIEVMDKHLATHSATRQPSSESLEKLGVGRKDLKRYSLARAMRMSMERWSKYDGVEGDLHRLLEKTIPSNFEQHNGGILSPFETRTQDEIDAWEERRLERHTMATNAPGKGMELVGTQTMPLVELLQAVPVAAQLGAVTNFLTGQASYPRVTGGPTVQFKGENSGAITPSDLVTGEIMSKGRNTIGAVPLTRALLMQTGGAADSYAKRLLVEGESLVVDRAIFGVGGSGEQPLGIYGTPTVLTQAAGSVTPTFTIITAMLAKVSRANGAFGGLGWITTPEIAARLMATPEIAAASAQRVWQGSIHEGMVAGYRAIASPQAPSTLGAGADEHCFAFGNWGLVHLNRWGAVEILVNPYSQALEGITLLHTYGLADCVFTQPQAMCVATAAKPL